VLAAPTQVKLDNIIPRHKKQIDSMSFFFPLVSFQAWCSGKHDLFFVCFPFFVFH